MANCVSRCSFTMNFFSFLLFSIVSLTTVLCENKTETKLTTEKFNIHEPTKYRFHYQVKEDTTRQYNTQKNNKEDVISGPYSITEPNIQITTITHKLIPTNYSENVVTQSFESGVKPNSEVTTHSSTVNFNLRNLTHKPGFTRDSEKIVETQRVEYEVNSEATTQLGGAEFNISATPASKRKLNTNTPTKMENKPTAIPQVVDFPQVFTTDSSNKSEVDTTTKMQMKFTANIPTTEYVPLTILETTEVNDEKTEDNLETTVDTKETGQISQMNSDFQLSETENPRLFTEYSDISEDPVEKELRETIDFLPKLPELILSDNKTHFKFYQDPEEVLLNERITQIARQLAETSLRREYEEQKLGHFIPISLRPIEKISPTYFAKRKSLKFTEHSVPYFRVTDSAPIEVLTEVKVVPQYILKQTLIPKIPVANNRLPMVKFKAEKSDQQIQKTTNDLQDKFKNNNSNNQVKEKLIKNNRQILSTTFKNLISTLPNHNSTPSSQLLASLEIPTDRSLQKNSTTPSQKDQKRSYKKVYPKDSIIQKDVKVH